MSPLLPLLLASVNRYALEDLSDIIDREARRMRDPLPTSVPLIVLPPTGPTCADCGVPLGRIVHTNTGADPRPRCWACIEAAPGRERMAAKRLRRLKRAGVYP